MQDMVREVGQLPATDAFPSPHDAASGNPKIKGYQGGYKGRAPSKIFKFTFQLQPLG